MISVRLKKRFKKSWKYLSVLAVIFILTRCIFIDNVIQVETLPAGEVLTTTVKLRLQPKSNVTTRLVVAILTPKKWNAAANAQLTYSSNIGDGRLTLAAPGSQPKNSGGKDWPTAINGKFGIGRNKIRDLEWVVYWSDQEYAVTNGQRIDADIFVKLKTGEQDVVVDLGYFAACTTEDINSTDASAVRFATLETTGGTGPVMNFLVPQLSLIDPGQSLDNDFITMRFDASLIPTNLTGAAEVFLCATAYTNDHQTIEVCGQTSKEKMKNVNRDVWQIDFWPRRYFGVSPQQSIDSMKYYFTNAAGDITVKQPDTDVPFTYKFVCE